MSLILKLTKNVPNSQKLSRDLLIVIQLLDCYQLSVSIFGNAVHQNPPQKQH